MSLSTIYPLDGLRGSLSTTREAGRRYLSTGRVRRGYLLSTLVFLFPVGPFQTPVSSRSLCLVTPSLQGIDGSPGWSY